MFDQLKISQNIRPGFLWELLQTELEYVKIKIKKIITYLQNTMSRGKHSHTKERNCKIMRKQKKARPNSDSASSKSYSSISGIQQDTGHQDEIAKDHGRHYPHSFVACSPCGHSLNPALQSIYRFPQCMVNISGISHTLIYYKSLSHLPVSHFQRLLKGFGSLAILDYFENSHSCIQHA
jgi:hypothetical protein